MELAERVALVTGGGRGIGQAVVRKLASLGADVVVSARTPAEVERVAAEVRATGRRACAIVADVGDRVGCETLFRETVDRMGRVDILVNNAGVTHFAPVDVETDEGWHYVMAVNLHSAFYLTRASLPGMCERRWGRIINMGSTSSVKGTAGEPAYTASKHGLLGLTRAIALDAAPYNVTVNAVCPWYVDTAMARGIADTEAERRGESTEVVWERMEASNPQGRMITAAEVAELVAFLCTSGARPITGQALVVASGYFTF
jgi:NAD(P)-dependent dehydrogenase (short-subunit alcohol dehydrogenase family)